MEHGDDIITTGEMLARIGALLAAETPSVGTAAERLNLAVTAVRLAGRVTAVASRLVADAERVDAGMVVAGMSVKNVLAHQLVMTSGAAAGLVRRSVALAGRPATLAAAEAGDINPEQAAVIVRAVDALPEGEVTADQVDAGEATMLEMAARFNPNSLKVLGGRLLEVIAPGEADRLEEARLEREWRAAQQDRFLQFRDTGHGVTTFSGLLPTTSAALLRAQLDAYAAAARRAEHAALAGLGNGHGGEGGTAVGHGDSVGSGVAAAAGPGVGAGLGSRLVLPLSRASMGQRRADALVAMAEQAAAESSPPAVGGDRPRIMVLMGYERLHQTARDHAAGLAEQMTGTGHGTAVGQPTGDSATDGQASRPDGSSPVDRIPAQLLSGERVPAGVLRRWLCDAELIPVVLGGDSQVLDVGRAKRFATPAQRTALTVRDRGCVFPGCDVPAPICEAHHTHTWATGGATDLPNLALLCWHHHALCEPGRNPRDQWLIEFRDGLPVAIPPARLDPTRTPRQHERFLEPG